MGFRRSVLERVPAFDTELGPGALGFGDDTLFGWQLSEAGFRIGYARSAGVIHHVNPSRLRRTEWLSAARSRGRSQAYLRYHWEHSDIQYPRLRQLYYFIKLQLRRVVQRPPPLESEGCPLWEVSYVLHMAMCKQFRLERRRPRNYARHGLTRRMPQGHVVKEVAGLWRRRWRRNGQRFSKDGIDEAKPIGQRPRTVLRKREQAQTTRS